MTTSYKQRNKDRQVQNDESITPEQIETILPVFFGFFYKNLGDPDVASNFPNAFDAISALLKFKPETRECFVNAGMERIISQLAKLNIPCIEGSLQGGSIIFLKNPDFEEHKPLYGGGSICVLEKHTTWHDNRHMLEGFSAKVRLSGSDTWLCVGISQPETIDEDDFDDEYDDDFGSEDRREEVSQEEKERIAIIVASSHGFRELKNREQRMAFAKPIIDQELGEKEWNTYLNPAYEIAQMSAEILNLGIIPMRAKELSLEGKTAAEIGKQLGISKQKAERAIAAEIPQYIADQLNRRGDQS